MGNYYVSREDYHTLALNLRRLYSIIAEKLRRARRRGDDDRVAYYSRLLARADELLNYLWMHSPNDKLPYDDLKRTVDELARLVHSRKKGSGF